MIPDIIKDAGAQSESDTDRDGAFSYHAESHAFGVGAGIAWLVLMTGAAELVGLVLPAITAGLRAKDRQFSKILTDVYQEPHYTLFGHLVGAVVAVPFSPLI
jgi:hypothetical protein